MRHARNYTRKTAVYLHACVAKILTSVIAGHMLCDWPPCCRSSRKGLDANGWACAASDNPHHVSLLLQICGTALDEGPTTFRPQVCPDCLQRHYGCLKRMDMLRGASMWPSLSPSELTSFISFCH